MFREMCVTKLIHISGVGLFVRCKNFQICHVITAHMNCTFNPLLLVNVLYFAIFLILYIKHIGALYRKSVIVKFVI